MPNQDYTESTQDLAVKTAGGRMSASPGQAVPIIAIGRADRIYKRVTAATLAAAQAQEEAAAAPLHPCPVRATKPDRPGA